MNYTQKAVLVGFTVFLAVAVWEVISRVLLGAFGFGGVLYLADPEFKTWVDQQLRKVVSGS